MPNEEQIEKLLAQEKTEFGYVVPFNFMIQVRDVVKNEISKAVEAERERIKLLVVDEINIAHSESQKTSRLTSLYNKIDTKE